MSAHGVTIRLEGLERRWEGDAGVQGISLDVPAGSFVTLLGPSGCGKSTTLRLIAGLEAADAGRVLINGRDMTGVSPDQRSLSMVFQSYALFPHLNVAENIIFGLKVRRVSRQDRNARLQRALELTDLTGLEYRRPAQLSGGQRQRVALARAIVADHPICLMDEPLSNLDAKLRQSVRREIRALQRRLGMTVVYVTHDQTEAMSMADIVVLMRDGLIEQSGAPQDLYDRPATAFSAGFIGSPPMALLPASALQLEIANPEQCVAGLRAGQVTSVRPQDARVSGRIIEAEYLGGETFASVSLEMAPGAPLALRLPADQSAEPGTLLGLNWPEHALHLFDRHTGMRLACPADRADGGGI